MDENKILIIVFKQQKFNRTALTIVWFQLFGHSYAIVKSRNALHERDRRNVVETASLTPRDKENAGANSTRNSQQSSAVDQPKVSSTSATTIALPPPSTRTPARTKLTTSQPPSQGASPSFFSCATTPSPATNNVQSLPAVKESSTSITQPEQATTPASPAFPPFSAQQSPPGTSQVLRKHFQSLGFASPPAKHTLQHQRLISSGAVRLTPSSRKKAHKGNQTLASRRVGFDGTKYTPSKELLKSTTSSRNQRVLALQDLSMEQATTLEMLHADDLQQQLQQTQPNVDVMDDETSTVASATTMDDASFDMSLPSVNQHPLISNSCNVIPGPNSPLTPRMGCLNPVALTLLNDGKEDYNYLLTQDALYPIPKVEDTTDLGPQPANTSMSSSSSTSSSCLSPTPSFGQSPAEVRATLSHTVRSTLARPVAIMAKTGRSSPPHTRLVMRPQPKHVR